MRFWFRENPGGGLHQGHGVRCLVRADRPKERNLHYQYHDGLLEHASLDAAARRAVLTFLLYAVFDRPQARVSLRFDGIYNFAAVQAYFAKVLSDAGPEADDCLDRCDALHWDTKRSALARSLHVFLRLAHYGSLRIHCEAVVETEM